MRRRFRCRSCYCCRLVLRRRRADSAASGDAAECSGVPGVTILRELDMQIDCFHCTLKTCLFDQYSAHWAHYAALEALFATMRYINWHSHLHVQWINENSSSIFPVILSRGRKKESTGVKTQVMKLHKGETMYVLT